MNFFISDLKQLTNMSFKNIALNCTDDLYCTETEKEKSTAFILYVVLASGGGLGALMNHMRYSII